MRFTTHRLRELVGLGQPLQPGSYVRHAGFPLSLGLVVGRCKVPHQDKQMWRVTVMWSLLPGIWIDTASGTLECSFHFKPANLVRYVAVQMGIP